MKLHRCVKIELWKAFHRKAYRVALIIALIIAAADIAQTVIEVKNLYLRSNPGAGWEGISLFTWWIGVNGYTFGHILYFFLWPLLAAIPYGSSYCAERQNGMSLQIVTRSGRKTYLLSKYIAIFVSSGTVMALPLFLNLMLKALFCPASVIRVSSMMTTIENGDFMSGVFFTNPWLFVLVWCCLDFLWGGAAGAICLAFGTAIRKCALLTLMPFILLVAIDLGWTLIRSVLAAKGAPTFMNLSPLSLANAGSSMPHTTVQLFTVLGTMIVIPLALFCCKERKNDLL